MTPFVALRNSLLQLMVDNLLLIVEAQLICNIQYIFDLGNLLGLSVWVIDGLLHFVQQPPDLGLTPPLFGQIGHRGFPIKFQ